jgi:hypothetical protein
LLGSVYLLSGFCLLSFILLCTCFYYGLRQFRYSGGFGPLAHSFVPNYGVTPHFAAFDQGSDFAMLKGAFLFAVYYRVEFYFHVPLLIWL